MDPHLNPHRPHLSPHLGADRLVNPWLLRARSPFYRRQSPHLSRSFWNRSPRQITAPIDGSSAGTVAITEDGDGDSSRNEVSHAGDFKGIEWERLPGYMKPLATQKRAKSWIFAHGYRVAERKDPSRLWFVCRYCHIHKLIDAGRGGIVDVTKATSSAATHLGLPKRGHNLTREGPRTSSKLDKQPPGQLSLRQYIAAGGEVHQETANALGNFNVQYFRQLVVLWLVENNHPLREITTPRFREIIKYLSPEGEAALWLSPTSVSAFAIRLFKFMQPQVVAALASAISKIHISFDGWTTKGGKRGFFGIVTHFADASGVIRDLPIDLPQLAGAHTGEAIAKAISETLQVHGITPSKLGYFVLDNAANNDTAVAALALEHGFNPAHRRLRCGCHTLNLIGQKIIFGTDKDAYDNVEEHYNTEEQYMRAWRKRGPLGVLIDVINYIKTPQQHELFRTFQQRANDELPAEKRLKTLEPVKPVVTRWNSYYAAFERATKLQAAYNLYAEHHINNVTIKDAHAARHNDNPPEAPSWMRSGGLTAADWAVITEYQDCLEPLKYATKLLEGRSRDGKYGAIYEIIPVFEYILSKLEARMRPYAQVNFNAHAEAPEDHLKINLSAAWHKANDYYNKLDASPAYYAAVCLHPYYKYYCDIAWEDRPEWLNSANAAFQQLWATYKPPRPRSSQTTTITSNTIGDAIGAILRRRSGGGNVGGLVDEFERWKTQEPEWTEDQYLADGNPVKYWIQLRPKYPNLARFAIDIITIPASSSDCERLFSELGDLLEPKRRSLGSQLLSALQLIRSWIRAGFVPLYDCDESELTNGQIISDYNIQEWDTPA